MDIKVSYIISAVEHHNRWYITRYKRSGGMISELRITKQGRNTAQHTHQDFTRQTKQTPTGNKITDPHSTSNKDGCVCVGPVEYACKQAASACAPSVNMHSCMQQAGTRERANNKASFRIYFREA